MKPNKKATRFTTSNKATGHSHRQRHRSSRYCKMNPVWYWFTKPFRKKERISGVRANQQIAEKRIMFLFTLGAVILLCLLIPLVTWLLEAANGTTGI